MRTEQARPVRLENYRPPDWLVQTVGLDVSLHPTATKVRATLKMSPNPKAEAPDRLGKAIRVHGSDIRVTRHHLAVGIDPFRKPGYLFAMVGGNLACVEDKFVTMSGREVSLRIYVEPGKEAHCGWAMDSL